MYEEIREEAYQTVKELCDKANASKGQILVVGCSTSEVCGDSIGSNSNLEVAKELFAGIYKAANEAEIYLAVQCCEHLNRAIIVERDAVPFSEYVNVVPMPKAGGSLATTAYQNFKNPVAIEEIKADLGLDIGDTLIGMHLKRVAVPLRLEHSKIGEAHLTAARTRAKFIGGERAHYNDQLM